MRFFNSGEGRNGRRARFGGNRPRMLRSSLRAQGRAGLRWIGVTIISLTTVLSILVIVGLGARKAADFLFARNTLFRIRQIDIECSGETLTRKHIMDYAQLEEWRTIFDSNIAELRERLLKPGAPGSVPRIKSIAISRRLPGALIIRVRERMPVARLEMEGYSMAVDPDGYVLGPSAGARSLTVITGHSMPGLKPGALLAGTSVMNALDVLDVCEKTPVGQLVQIVAIDVRDRDFLELHLADGERVKLAWQNMQTRSALSRENLERKMAKLAECLKAADERCKRIATIDMTLENNFPMKEY